MLGPVEESNQSLGIIIRASKDGQSALIFEINKHHRFRIRQLMDGRSQSISKEGKDGWIKNNALKGVNEYNNINIQTNGTDHDLYINGILVYSFRIEGLNKGNFGLYIGPETKGRIDYFNVYADELYRDKNKIYLTDDEVRDLIKENENLKIKLEQSLDARAIELENVIRILENQLKALQLINEQLDMENSKYAVIKSAIDTSEVDLLLNLSYKVIDKSLESRQLKIENKIITDSLSNMKSHFDSLELELFQKVISKKLEEQNFIDSILMNFCSLDTVFIPIDSLFSPTLQPTDSVTIDSLNNQK